MHTDSDRPACTSTAAGHERNHIGAPVAARAVLWVERDTFARRAIAPLLQQLGFKVTFAADAFQAMNIVAEDLRAFDIVVMDSDLPDLDAVELAHYLRSARADWRLLLCCGADAEWMRDWVHEAEFPCDQLLVRPLDVTKLEAALRQAQAGAAGVSARRA